MKKFALVVAGGGGTRMANAVPKQFIEVLGKPVLMHTFEAFLNYDKNIEFVLVLPEKEVQRWKTLCKKHHFEIKFKLAFGGETRYQSVKNGLKLLSDTGIVFIHDGVRPLVSAQTLRNCEQMTKAKGNALPVIPVAESIREVVGNKNKPADRSKLFFVQTPQTFKSGLIKKAYQQNFSEPFTDDASVLEKAGEKIYLVEGNRENIKITYPQDILIVEKLLVNSKK